MTFSKKLLVSKLNEKKKILIFKNYYSIKWIESERALVISIIFNQKDKYKRK